MAKLRQLISSDEAPQAVGQHTTPCSDCPMARTALNGWLGGSTPEEYRQLAHSDDVVECHALRGAQCAGIAIYRRNVCKRARPPNLILERDTELVFATPMEFVEHHSKLPTLCKEKPCRTNQKRTRKRSTASSRSSGNTVRTRAKTT